MEKTFLLQVREAKAKNGSAFKSFKGELGNGGKLVDVRMKKDVDLKLFEGGELFKVTCEVSDASANYIYPRFYAGNFKTVERIK